MKWLKMICVVLAVAGVLQIPQPIAAQEAVAKSVLGNGGAVLSDSSYRILGTLGQPFIGVAKNSANVNRVGFWYLQVEVITTAVEETPNNVPQEFRLQQNYPNPFNPTTTIKYHLPKTSKIKLVVYNLLGQRVATLVDEQQPAGIYAVQWQGKADTGREVASGVYLYRLETEDFVRVKKLALMR